MQSIYAGFVGRNILAIPPPLGSRGSKGLLHKKKENVCAKEGLHFDCQWYLFEKIRPFCFSQPTDSVCPKPTVPNPTHVVAMHKKKANVCANEGLHSDCQWYLFEKIRPFCFSQPTDSVCPKPTVPNPTHIYLVEM